MVSGGSGITPFISIIRHLIHRASIGKKTPRVYLICAFKNSTEIAMLDVILPDSGPIAISDFHLKIDAYITREKIPCAASDQEVREIWFNSNPSDGRIYPVLGPNSWLWLGIIISSSFILFLFTIGVVTRYYIYPIDHNTNMIYSSIWRCGLNMAFICLSIALVCTIAFLRNKKVYGEEMEMVKKTCPGSWFYNVDKEMDSLKHQLYVQEMKVHYGERPNLKSKRIGFVVCCCFW